MLFRKKQTYGSTKYHKPKSLEINNYRTGGFFKLLAGPLSQAI